MKMSTCCASRKKRKRRASFHRSDPKWREQLNYEKSRDTQSPIKTCESMIRRYEAELT
jgi:structural maintenance of chromosome 1